MPGELPFLPVNNMGIQIGTSVNVFRMPPARILAAGQRPRTSMDMAPEVVVIFTSDKGTQAALRAAVQVARAGGKGMLLVVPEIVSFSLAYANPPIAVDHLVQRLLPSISALGVVTRVQVVLCNDEMGALKRMLKSPSLIYLGGSARKLWPTEEYRLARSLRQLGHEVIFVNEV
jgi:hypothetical protein